MRSQFKLPIDIQSIHFTQGSREAVNEVEPELIQTSVWFITPFNLEAFKPNAFKTQTSAGPTVVRFLIVESEASDVIFQASKNFILASDGHGGPLVPTRFLTDNRGHYPCLAAEVIFSRRLDGDTCRIPNVPITESERERIELMGADPMPEKLASLVATNRIIKEQGLPNLRALSASEVTALVTTHTRKTPQVILARTVSLVTTETAFRDSVYDYYLGDAKETIGFALAALRKTHPTPPASVEELNELVLSAIDEVLILQIETRRLIQPFWDGFREIKLNDQIVKVPRSPKKEIDIQPTLHTLLQMALEPFGVHVIRESDEGSGLLDFRFSSTSQDAQLLSVAAEFKLAHHKEIKAGITKQLPRYMESIPTSHGIFVLMWFRDKDGKYFFEPQHHTLEETRLFLEELASKPIGPSQKISSRVIDFSIRPSASKLR